MQLKKTHNCQSSSKGKEQNWRHKTLPDIRQYCEVTSIKIHWFWQKTDTWINGTESTALK